MRIVRFRSDDGSVHLGQQVDDNAALLIEGDLLGGHRVTERRVPIGKRLAPLVPTDILCIGLNYREHAKESKSEVPDNPMLFIKSSNSLNNPLDPIPVPRVTSQVDFEGEL